MSNHPSLKRKIQILNPLFSYFSTILGVYFMRSTWNAKKTMAQTDQWGIIANF